MAFKDRGNIPSIDLNDEAFINHPYRYWRYYIPLDNTYVLMQMAVTFIILICGVFSFIAFYKSSISDPIISTKNLYINTHIFIILALLITTLIINSFSKSKQILIKRLIILLIVSIIITITFFTIKFNMDYTYTYNKFEQLYENLEINNETGLSKIGVGLGGMTIKTEKEYYIDECIKLYNIFKIKTYGILTLNILLDVLLGYQISKISKLEETKNKQDKDDQILFDEDQGII